MYLLCWAAHRSLSSPLCDRCSSHGTKQILILHTSIPCHINIESLISHTRLYSQLLLSPRLLLTHLRTPIRVFFNQWRFRDAQIVLRYLVFSVSLWTNVCEASLVLLNGAVLLGWFCDLLGDLAVITSALEEGLVGVFRLDVLVSWSIGNGVVVLLENLEVVAISDAASSLFLAQVVSYGLSVLFWDCQRGCEISVWIGSLQGVHKLVAKVLLASWLVIDSEKLLPSRGLRCSNATRKHAISKAKTKAIWR